MFINRKLICPWCETRYGEGSAGWDSALRDSKCHKCHRFLEVEREAEVERLARSPEVLDGVRRSKLFWISVGALCDIVIGVVAVGFATRPRLLVGLIELLEHTHLIEFLWPVATGAVAGIVFPILWTPERAARKQLAGPLNVAKYFGGAKSA
jgi:hypothetical protein